MPSLNLSSSQRQVLNQMWRWWRTGHHRQPYLTVGGYAGTGKTTALAVFRDHLLKTNPKLKLAAVSFTGKAARVLRQALKKRQAIGKNDHVGTIHSLIYEPIIDKQEVIVGWARKKKLNFDLILVDEASMVDQKIWQDLTSFDVPIIAVGDHGQLPPVEGSFYLLQEPMLRLEEIHRQAADNPIIKLSLIVRQTGHLPVKRFGPKVVKLDRHDPETSEVVDSLLVREPGSQLVLAGYNRTRIRLNQHIRVLLGFESAEPMVGDRVICLRNNHKKGVYNGMLGTISSLVTSGENHFKKAEINLDDEQAVYRGLILLDQFGSLGPLNLTRQRARTLEGDLFDFGYALTVHKAQGSQAPKVIVFEERFAKMDDETWRRWLYTAVTRAEEELWVIGE